MVGPTVTYLPIMGFRRCHVATYSYVLTQLDTYGFELLHKRYSAEQQSRVPRRVGFWQRCERVIGK
jgi:hypothetical protein